MDDDGICLEKQEYKKKASKWNVEICRREGQGKVRQGRIEQQSKKMGQGCIIARPGGWMDGAVFSGFLGMGLGWVWGCRDWMSGW